MEGEKERVEKKVKPRLNCGWRGGLASCYVRFRRSKQEEACIILIPISYFLDSKLIMCTSMCTYVYLRCNNSNLFHFLALFNHQFKTVSLRLLFVLWRS